MCSRPPLPQVSLYVLLVGLSLLSVVGNANALACRSAAEVAAKLIKAGGTNTAVTEAITKVAKAYDVNPIQGTLMHQMKR